MKELISHRLAGLLRTRVIVSTFSVLMVYLKPEIGHYVIILAGFSMGVSAVDAWKGLDSGGGKGKESGDTKGN